MASRAANDSFFDVRGRGLYTRPAFGALEFDDFAASFTEHWIPPATHNLTLLHAWRKERSPQAHDQGG